jgi:hypothetical protein
MKWSLPGGSEEQGRGGCDCSLASKRTRGNVRSEKSQGPRDREAAIGIQFLRQRPEERSEDLSRGLVFCSFTAGQKNFGCLFSQNKKALFLNIKS